MRSSPGAPKCRTGQHGDILLWSRGYADLEISSGASSHAPRDGELTTSQGCWSHSRHWAPRSRYRAIPESNHVSFLPGFSVSQQQPAEGARALL